LHLTEIAADESPPLGITAESALSYFRDNLHFVLGDEELNGLRHFYHLCVEGEFAPRSSDLTKSHQMAPQAAPRTAPPTIAIAKLCHNGSPTSMSRPLMGTRTGGFAATLIVS